MTLSEDMKIDPTPETSIVNHRVTRFLGATQTCNFSELSPGSIDGLRWLYDWLEKVGECSSKDLHQPTVQSIVEALITRDNVNRVVGSAQNVIPTKPESTRLALVLHDLRGAALSQLVGLADLWLSTHSLYSELQPVLLLARDHAKVMRHSFIGLDEKRRRRDSAHRLHGVRNLRNRFPILKLQNADGQVQVDFAAEWNGDFAVTCPEFSTVLKQLYNLMNNAARHTADQTVLVRIYPKPSAEPQSVRLVVANTLNPAERASMSTEVLAKLWRGYTTTGSGLGLIACAALVSDAFGLETAEEALGQGYVGSRITDNGYIAWLHWPAAVNVAT